MGHSISEKQADLHRFKKAAVIMVNENCLNQASKDIPRIWFNILRNAMKGYDGGDRR